MVYLKWLLGSYLSYLMTVNSMIRIIKIIARYGLVSLKSTQAVFSSSLTISFSPKNIIMIPRTAELIRYSRLSEKRYPIYTENHATKADITALK